MRYEYELRGYVVGDIWMPQTECFKPIGLRFERSKTGPHNYNGGVFESLRDAALHVTNDGDFQSCEIAQGELIVRQIQDKPNGRIVRERVIPLDAFPSVKDMTRDDEWDVPPEYYN
jgi:hypothetical protein